jgi:hypothetical protein
VRIASVILILCLTSCSANWHLKQAMKKDPTLVKPKIVKVIDTLIVTDSFVHLDTFVAKELDTIVLDNDKSQIVIYKIRDRFIVKTKIKSDTVRVVKNIEMPSVIEYHEKKSILNEMLVWLFVGCWLIGVIILYYAKKMGNTK